MPNLLISYDSCPRIVAYGVDTTTSSLKLNSDVQRLTPLAAPALQGATLYGRCSIFPTAGAVFQSVTLSALNIVQLSSPANIDLGNQLGATFLTLISPATSADPSNPQWDFDLVIDAGFFALTQQYYLEATLDLTFANTGALTKRLLIPLSAFAAAARGEASLRQSLRQQQQLGAGQALELVEVGGGRQLARDANAGQQSVQSPLFSATRDAATMDSSSSSSSSTAVVVGIAAGVAGLLVVAALLVVVVVMRRRRRQAASEEHNRLPESAVNGGDSNIDIL
jgi:hypothetical protein